MPGPNDPRMVSPTPVGGVSLYVVTKPAGRTMHRQAASQEPGESSSSSTATSTAPTIGADLGDILAEFGGADLHPVFDQPPGAQAPTARRLYMQVSSSSATESSTSAASVEPNPALLRFQRLEPKTKVPDAKLEELAARLRMSGTVDAAYVKHEARPAIAFRITWRDMATPRVTPDFRADQKYLLAAPLGFDSVWANTLPGGRGAGVQVIDCEESWQANHEDLATLHETVPAVAGKGKRILGDVNIDDDTHHGTAVLGIIGADSNPYGISGMAPDADLRAYSNRLWPEGKSAAEGAKIHSQQTSKTIKAAADLLAPGDILLLEIHRPGPKWPKDTSQLGYLPVEWWPDDFQAIKTVTDKGIIVVEAGGNGYQNLDLDVYDKGFAGGWTNPFRLQNPQSGAIMVGAAQPERRSRLDFSNYGRRMDVHGWGEGVTSCGYGDLQGGKDFNRIYTDSFSGTSSASPCVVGCLAIVQGILKARARRPLTPAEAKRLLRLTGVQQTDTPKEVWPGTAEKDRPFRTERIGSRPNLRALVPAACGWSTRCADYNGDGVDEMLVTSPSGIALLRLSVPGPTDTVKSGPPYFKYVTGAAGRSSVGGNGNWLVDPSTNAFGPTANFEGDGKASIFVSRPRGITVLWLNGSDFATTVTHMQGDIMPSQTDKGQAWTLDTTTDSFGPAGDFDGDGKAELLVRKPGMIGILKRSSRMEPREDPDTKEMKQTEIQMFKCQLLLKNGTNLSGAWTFQSDTTEFSRVGRFSPGCGKAQTELFAVGPWGIGVLQVQTPAKQAAAVKAVGLALNDKTRLSGWTLNTATQRFDAVGDFDGDGRDEIVAVGPDDIAILKLDAGGNFSLLAHARADDKLAAPGAGKPAWTLTLPESTVGPARDFDGDGRAELLVTCPGLADPKLRAGATVLKYMASADPRKAGTLVPLAVVADGAKLAGGWTLDVGDNWLGGAARFGKNGRDGILVTSSTGVAVLEYADGALVARAVAQNGVVLGQWRLDTAADNFGHGF